MAAVPDSLRTRDPHQRLAMAMLSSDPWRWISEDAAAWIEEVDWDRFLADTDNIVLPYLDWVCRQPPFEGFVPPRVKEQLAREHQAAGIRSLRWASELRAILASFDENRLPLMLVKGSVLQRTVYPAPSTRPMSDLDLVVRREDVARAGALLERLGYSLRTSPENQTPMPGLQVDEECYFVKTVSGIALLVEMHTRLDFGDTSLAVSPRPIWELGTRLAGHDGMSIPTLEPNAALRHLCIHVAQHHDLVRGLLWLLDLRLFVERFGAQIRWTEFAAECTPESRPYVALALMLASEWLGADVPDEARAGFSPEDRNALMDLAWDQVWDVVRGRRPPGSLVLLGMSGDWGRMVSYVRDRWRRWTLPVPGRSISPAILVGKRVITEFRTYRAAAREGGFAWSSLKTAHRSERRSAQLKALLSRRRQ